LNRLTLTKSQYKTMLAHIELCAPLEACGLLAGKDGTVSRVFLIANQAKSPERFRMEPVEQVRALHWMEANSLDLLAIFHSHPTGPEALSATDIAEAAYEVVQIIWSHSNPSGRTWQARGFRIENGRLLDVELEFTDG
jgi:proteasome lid subunit RPN8/RPN11